MDFQAEKALKALRIENQKWIQENNELPNTQHKTSENQFLTDRLEGNARYPVLRTCREYLDQFPSSQSGNYFIDPDGLGVGEIGFEVYCDLSTGTTVISHDSEATTSVSKCPEPGCYKRNVTYYANRNQIQAIKALSYGCRQKIQIDCKSAPLYFNGIYYSWWQDHNGQNQYHWSGNGDRNHVCTCGYSNTCVAPDVQCNCDAYLPELLSDVGYLSNKKHLPVRQLNLGGNRLNSSESSYTLGKLECYGKISTGTTPSSCLDLWINGHVFDGFYTIQKNDLYQVVYCDMDKLLLEEMEVYQGIMDVPFQNGIYFYARRSSPVTGPIRITYDQIDSAGCRFSNGMFITERAGFYSFSFITHTLYNSTKVDMVVNGNTPIGISMSSHNNTLSIDSTVYLNVNDTVAILLIGTIDSNGQALIQFTGGLLQN